jgi:hypothetical protein
MKNRIMRCPHCKELLIVRVDVRKPKEINGVCEDNTFDRLKNKLRPRDTR